MKNLYPERADLLFSQTFHLTLKNLLNVTKTKKGSEEVKDSNINFDRMW